MKKSTKKTAAVAAGVAAAGALAAAGYYFYGHKNAKRHRGAAKKWVRDFKGDVVREAKRLENVTAKDFDTIVENVSRTYRGMKDVDLAALAAVARELKSNWRLVKEEAEKARGRRPAKKTARSAKRTVASAKKRTKRAGA